MICKFDAWCVDFPKVVFFRFFPPMIFKSRIYGTFVAIRLCLIVESTSTNFILRGTF